MNPNIKTLRIVYRIDDMPGCDYLSDIDMKDVSVLNIRGLTDEISIRQDLIVCSKSCSFFHLEIEKTADRKFSEKLTLFERIKKYNDISFIELYDKEDNETCIYMPYDSIHNNGTNPFQFSYIDKQGRLCIIVEKTTKEQEDLDEYYLSKL